MFVKKNLNPNNNKTSDCTVRALAAATGISWDDSFKMMANEAYRLKLGADDIKVFESLLAQYNFRKVSCKVEKGQHRPTVKELARSYSSNIIVARVAHHVVTCINGDYIDTWDSGDKAVYSMYIKM